jgi:hypothetical protein
MSKLSDDELDAIEAMRSTADALRLKAGAAPPPPPEGDRAIIADLCGRIDRLLEQAQLPSWGNTSPRTLWEWIHTDAKRFFMLLQAFMLFRRHEQFSQAACR